MTDWIKVPDFVELCCIKCNKRLKYASKEQTCTECDREQQMEERGFVIQTFY